MIGTLSPSISEDRSPTDSQSGLYPRGSLAAVCARELEPESQIAQGVFSNVVLGLCEEDEVKNQHMPDVKLQWVADDDRPQVSAGYVPPFATTQDRCSKWMADEDGPDDWCGLNVSCDEKTNGKKRCGPACG